MRNGALAAVAVAVLVAAGIRLRFAEIPLERDEGEYAYAGQLILQGVPPYEAAYNMKFPGTYYAYAAILGTFGESPRGIRLGLILVNAATALLVALVGRRLLGGLGGAFAGCAFVVLSLDRGVLGIFAHATHFIILPMMAAVWLLLRARDSGRGTTYAGAGALLGVAVLMKQHAAVFPVAAAALVAWDAMRLPSSRAREAVRRIAWLVGGSALPMAGLVGLLAAEAVLGRFWFWTIHYARAYAAMVPFSDAPAALRVGLGVATAHTLPLWVAAGLGGASLAARRWPAETRTAILGLFAASFLAICPGFQFRNHYVITLLPALALLIGAGAASLAGLLETRISRDSARALVAAAGLVLVGWYGHQERGYLFTWSPRDLSRLTYGRNPFLESPEIARYLREHTAPDARIAVIGSEPQIYFYAQRRSATGYLYTYPLVEIQQYASTMQDEMIRQIESAHPPYVVFVKIKSSWIIRKDSDRRVLRWAASYLGGCYDMVGIADIYAPDVTAWVWDGEVPGYQPRSDNLVLVYRRKSEAPCAAAPTR